MVHSNTSKWFLHTPWIISMQPHQELSLHTILLVMDLQKMLSHIADTLPPMLHLPVSPDETLHFYRYLCTHILIENKQFLLLIDVPIQDRSWQITIHKVLTLSIPHGNYSAHYDIIYQVFRHYQGCNHGGRTFNYLVLSLPRSKSSISVALPYLFSLWQTHHLVFLGSQHARNTADITSQCSLQIWKSIRCKFANPDITRCLDPHNPTSSPTKHHDADMSQKGHRNHHNMKICTYTEATDGMQCHLIKLLPTT